MSFLDRATALLAIACIGCLLAGNAFAAKDRASCDRLYRPEFGQRGKDVSWEPTTDSVAVAMLQMANTTERDRVYDLGAGEGAIIIAAAKKFGANAVGIEFNPDLVKLGQCYIESAGLADKAKLIEGDIFKTDFSDATVLMLFLTDSVDDLLRPVILKMTPGTRIVSHKHKMGDWRWDDEVHWDHETAYLWIVPAQVQGAWEFSEAGGGDSFALTLSQEFQKLAGTLRKDGNEAKVTGELRGADISVSLGGWRKLAGKVENNKIIATISTPFGRSKHYVGVSKP